MTLELLTEEEPWSLLREHGIGSLQQVRSACLQSDGELSVVRADAGAPDKPRTKPRKPAA